MPEDNTQDQALSKTGEVDFDAITFFEEAKDYIAKMANKPQAAQGDAVAAGQPADPSKPAFVAMYQLGDTVVYFPFDKDGNLIPQQPKEDDTNGNTSSQPTGLNSAPTGSGTRPSARTSGSGASRRSSS